MNTNTKPDFDIRDSRNQYQPCPNCHWEIGMVLLTRDRTAFIVCSICDFEGPKIPFEQPGAEVDRQAFEAWNNLERPQHSAQNQG